MRGMFAKKDFKKGEEMLFIPFNMIISVEQSKLIDMAPQLKKHGLHSDSLILNNSNMIHLIIFILEEIHKDKNSYFFHYFKTLPASNNFPLFFMNEEKGYLNGSPFLNYTESE